MNIEIKQKEMTDNGTTYKVVATNLGVTTDNTGEWAADPYYASYKWHQPQPQQPTEPFPFNIKTVQIETAKVFEKHVCSVCSKHKEDQEQKDCLDLSTEKQEFFVCKECFAKVIDFVFQMIFKQIEGVNAEKVTKIFDLIREKK